MYRILFFAFWLMIGLALSTCQSAQPPRELRLAHGLDISHPVHQAMVFMAQQVAALSEGTLTLRIYPSQQLGTERECLELLQIGSLAMTKVSSGVLENFAPDFQVLGLPYLFRDKAHQVAVLDGPIGEELLQQGSDYWLRGLCFYDAGSRSFYTRSRPVHAPDDLKGLKIRVMESTTAMQMVTAFGGSPTPISYGELYTALQQGVADGAENNPPSFYLSRHYEVCRYYSLNEHTALPDVLLIGTKAWNQLTAPQQQWLRTAARASALHQRTLWAASEAEALAALEAAGVEIIRPDKAAFADRVQALHETYRAFPARYQLIEQIRQEGVAP